MNINELSEEEKSVMLAKVMEWIRPHDELLPNLWLIEINLIGWTHQIWRREPNILPGFNLYDPANMAGAWRVIEWITAPSNAGLSICATFIYWWKGYEIWANTAQEAQAAWLDKILQLAIEAGMIEETP